MTLRDSYLRIRVTRDPTAARRVRSVELTDPYTGEVLGDRVDEVVTDD